MMRQVYWMRLAATCGCGLLLAVSNTARGSDALPSPDEILRRVWTRSQAPEAAAPSYFLCTKQTVTEELDTHGRVTQRKVRVRENRSQRAGAEDVDKWTSQNGVNLGEDLLKRFNFSVIGKTNIDGRAAFHLTFVPKVPPAPVRDFRDRLLNKAMGVIWVDATEDELVKAHLCLSEPVSFGIIGGVESLAFSFERTRATEGAWLTRWTETQFKGRKFLKWVQTRKRVDWSEYRPLEAPRATRN